MKCLILQAKLEFSKSENSGFLRIFVEKIVNAKNRKLRGPVKCLKRMGCCETVRVHYLKYHFCPFILNSKAF